MSKPTTEEAFEAMREALSDLVKDCEAANDAFWLGPARRALKLAEKVKR